MSGDVGPMIVRRQDDGTLQIVNLGAEVQHVQRSVLVELVHLLNKYETQIEQLRAERDDHKARLAVEAVTAPDADYDTMVDSLQARICDMWAEIERLQADVADLTASGLALCDESDAFRANLAAERALADQLASHLQWALECIGSLPMQLRATFDARMAEVLAAYEEARRER